MKGIYDKREDARIHSLLQSSDLIPVRIEFIHFSDPPRHSLASDQRVTD